MYSNIENDCFTIYNQIIELGEHVYGGENDQKSLIQECIDFQKKWNVQIGAEKISSQCKSDFITDCESIKRKLLWNTKKCVVLGRTSSGKSTLINALLAKEVLSTSFGETSNCLVEISASPTNENYLVINNEKRNIEEIKDLNNLLSDETLENGSRIKMYYDKNKCQLLKDDVVIIDTPGYDSSIFDNNLMNEYFDDADIVVLVVNALMGINNEDEKLLKKYKPVLEKLNLVIIYNFWDIVNPKDRNGKIKMQLLEKAKRNLKEVLNIDDTNVDSFIYFVSSSERISILTSKNSKNFGQLWNERNTSFRRFFDYLIKKMSESLFKKKYKFLKKLKCKVEMNFNQCDNCFIEMKKNRSNLAQNIEFELDNIYGFKESFNELISKNLRKTFELLLIQCFNFIKSDKKIDNVKLKRYIFNFINKRLEIIGDELRDIIKHENDTISAFRQNIFNEIYFPRYFNLNKELNSIDIEKFRENLMIIQKETDGNINDKLFAGIGLFGGLVGGLFGVLIGSNKVAATGFISAATMATTILSGNKQDSSQFQIAVEYIRNLLNKLIVALNDSYAEFIDCMVSNVTELIKPVEKKINKIQNNLNNIAKEFQNFGKSLSINEIHFD